MLTVLRRLFWLGLVGGAGYAGWILWRRQAAPTPAAAPEWPPLPPLEPQATRRDVPAADVPVGRTWVEPIDGACPDGYPIKANDNSGIYHVPGGRFYARTAPERCYASTEDAEADGYRAAKA
jgi:hypothetical protein